MGERGKDQDIVHEREWASQSLKNFQMMLSQIEQNLDVGEKQSQFESVTEQFNQLALEVFSVELGHFSQEGQETIGSKYKNAMVEQARTLSSMFAAVVLAPVDEQDIRVSEHDFRYQIFTRFQRDQLSIESFNQLREEAFAAASTKGDLLTITTILAIHDTSKLASVASEISSATGVQSVDHDLLLANMMQLPHLVAKLAPGLNRLSKDQRERAMSVINLGFNRGQLAQAEATPIHLTHISPENVSDEIVKLQRFENTCDIAGVTGGLGVILGQGVFEAYATADQVVDSVRSGEKSIEDAYLDLLRERAEMMGVDVEFEEDDFYTKEGREKIALFRFSCLLRLTSNEEFAVLQKSYENLGIKARNYIYEMFGRSGRDGRLAVLFYYAPSLMVETRDKEVQVDPENGEQFGTEKGLRLLSRICRETQIFLGEIDEEPEVVYVANGDEKTFEQIQEIRGMTHDTQNKPVEIVVALTNIVKDNANKMLVVPVAKEEAIINLVD